MELMLLVLACLLATGAHWLVRRDLVAAGAVGFALFVFALVPWLAAQFGG